MKTQTAAHTPTPWKVSENENTPLTLNEYHRIHAGIDDICFVEKTDRDLSSEKYIEVDQANAAYIVRAVNAHEELLAALKNLVERNLIKDINGDHYEEVLETIAKAEAGR